ncbi:glycosyltransferase [Pontibacter harenae]|uniref:glycosyltransferase n=1 Tax=Pontibacter harenae TaxID=2894083 RepID=UPI001E361E6F|nr:glycosyltransferase [Pontibacter harenae]MCC9166593.1 glycosyltransferase [Pontibacter harenae]
MKKILIVSPSFPYPANYGGGVDIWRRIISLVKMGNKVDLIATVKDLPNKEDLDYVKNFVDKVYLISRENKIIDLFSMFPLQVKSRQKLKELVLNDLYDITLLEGDYVGLILENKSLKSTHLVLRSHNDEKEYFKKLALSSDALLNSLYYFSEFIKFKFYTKKILLKKIKNILFISFTEFSSFNNQEKKDQYQSVFLPTPIDKKEFKTRELKGNTVVFVGSLFMPNNQEAILWYLKNVHPGLVSVPDYKFLIIGSTRGHDISTFENKLNNYKSIEYHIDVTNLEYIYERSSVFVNPMLNGAGVKIKSINAIIEGLPLVSTRVGIEGTGLINGQHYLEANSPNEFKSSIKKLLMSTTERKKIAAYAQRFLIEHNHDLILDEFIRVLHKQEVH